jgi:hypothetical protein
MFAMTASNPINMNRRGIVLSTGRIPAKSLRGHFVSILVQTLKQLLGIVKPQIDKCSNVIQRSLRQISSS